MTGTPAKDAVRERDLANVRDILLRYTESELNAKAALIADLIADARKEGERGDSWRAGVQAALALVDAQPLAYSTDKAVDSLIELVKLADLRTKILALAAGPAPRSYEDGRRDMAREAAALCEARARDTLTDPALEGMRYIVHDTVAVLSERIRALSTVPSVARELGRVDGLREAAETAIRSRDAVGIPFSEPRATALTWLSQGLSEHADHIASELAATSAPPRDVASDPAREIGYAGIGNLACDEHAQARGEGERAAAQEPCVVCGGDGLSTRPICSACEPDTATVVTMARQQERDDTVAWLRADCTRRAGMIPAAFDAVLRRIAAGDHYGAAARKPGGAE